MGFKKVSGHVTWQFLAHFLYFLYLGGAVGQEEVGEGVVYKVRSEGHFDSGLGHSTALPAVCLSWSVCGCVAGLQPFLFFGRMSPWNEVHLPGRCVALVPSSECMLQNKTMCRPLA